MYICPTLRLTWVHEYKYLPQGSLAMHNFKKINGSACHLHIVAWMW